jgi:CBS domain-containing protein/nucleotide-binding universal stress UspA family protein
MKLKTLIKTPAIMVEDSAPVAEAGALMRRHGVQCLPVLRRNELVGLITDLHLETAGLSSVPEIRRHDWSAAMARLTVAEVMSRRPSVLSADTPVADAARLAAGGVDAFVVLDGGELAGVVTRRDLLAVLGGLLEHRHPTGLGHILAATSLRSGMRGALGEALRLATTSGAAITALHVLPLAGRLPSVEGATAQEVGRIERARQRIAREALATMCRAGGAHGVTCDVGEGAVAPEIARRATELESDLIVIGKTTPRGWRRLGGRTLADQLVRLAPCPVLAIPREPRTREADASR